MLSQKKMKFKNKIVLITGASSGIGAATAVEFAKEGAKVSLTGRNVANLEKTAKKCREAGLGEDDIFIVSGDLSKQDDCLSIVDKTVKNFGRLEILVNNAGWFVNKGLMDTTVEEMDSMLNIFVRAVFTMTQRALPSIIENKGAVVNVSSIASRVAYIQHPAYSIAKSAMDQYARILALEVADKGVRVNTVNPGGVLTNIVGDIESEEKGPHGLTIKQAMTMGCQEIHPNKRPATPEEVAKAITFLASEEASMITGAFLPIDGGWSLAGPQKDIIDRMNKAVHAENW